MKRKFLLLFLMSFVTLTSVNAIDGFRPIVLRRYQTEIILPPIIVPTSVSSDSQIDFEAETDDNVVVVHATSGATTASILIGSQSGWVYQQMVNMQEGSSFTIDATMWATGSYYLIIHFGRTRMYGTFDITKIAIDNQN